MNYLDHIYFAAIKASEVGIEPVSGQVVKNALNAVYFWAGVLAVLAIIAGGFYYVLSNGNAQQITRAKNAIFGAVIGLIVVLSAFVITNIVIGGVS